MQYTFYSSNPFIQILEDTLKKPDEIYLISIDPNIVVNHQITAVSSIIDHIIQRGFIEQAAARIAFDIDGYDDDLRDPVEIPDIRTYFEKLNNALPVLPFFLENNESQSLIRYAGFLVDVFYDEDNLNLDSEQLQTFLSEKSALIATACNLWRIDPTEHIARLWSTFELEAESSEFEF